MRNFYSLLIIFLVTIIFLANESQAQWTQVDNPHGGRVQALVSTGQNIFAGINGNDSHNGGIYRSTDNGDSWFAVDSGLVKNGNDTLDILCLSALGDTIVAGTDGDGIYISTNNGDSWKQRNNGIADSTNLDLKVTAVGAFESKIYAGILGVGIFVSSDGGQNWKLIVNGLPLNHDGRLEYFSINAFGFVGSNIYLIGNGSYLSTNGGANWTPSTGNTETSRGGMCFASIGDVMFIGTGGDTTENIPFLLRSTVNDKLWEDISTSYKKVSDGAPLISLTVYDNTLIAGSFEGGIYVSHDSGTTWIPLNKGLDYKSISVVSLTTSKNYLIAGSDRYGIWRISLSPVVAGTESKKEILPTNYSLQQNYPNPFNPSTVISYQLSKLGHVKLNVYNVLGEKVAQLVNKEQSAGSYRITFNASNLATGIYFYKLQAGNFTSVKKMVLLK